MKSRSKFWLTFSIFTVITLAISSSVMANEQMADDPPPPERSLENPVPLTFPLGLSLPEIPQTEPESFIAPKIIGGNEVFPENAYPWTASLQFYGDHYCGGALIDPEWVLTAAHCWVDIHGFEFPPTPGDKVVLGEHSLSIDSGLEQYRNISEVYIHPRFDIYTFEYDLALVKLSTPATLNDDVQPLEIVKSNVGNLTGQASVITGWGQTVWDDENSASDDLLYANINILANSACSNYVDEEGYLWFRSDSMLCAGTLDGSKDSCYGDSGGALAYQDNGVWKAAGIVSWGHPQCGLAGYPGVYARVSSSSSWINSFINPVFRGGAEITSNQPVVAISRPHIGLEIMAYNGANAGANTVYLPMLFNKPWGGQYTSSFTVQNLGGGTATFDLTFKDAADGSTTCVIENETLPQHGVRTYDVTNLPTCDIGDQPDAWFGGATISSDQPLTAVARPNVDGTDAVTYSGVTGGAATAYLPMLFRGIWGYQAAFYVQNLHASTDATLTIEFYDNQGNHTCTYSNAAQIGPSETKGFWMANIKNTNCSSGTGFSSSGWAGSAVITSSGSDNIVAIGRPHLGTEVAAYNGFTAGGTTNYLPMLFRGIWGYDAAFYIQNISPDPTTIEITFYDTAGNEVCTYTDPTTLAQNATRGYWTPYLNCNDGSNFNPAGWAGSAKIVTSQDVIAVGRPHLTDNQVVAYTAFTGGATEAYLPMNFWQWYGNETAVYIQNLGGSDADTTITFYGEDSGYLCSMDKIISPGSAGAIWLANLTDAVCVP